MLNFNFQIFILTLFSVTILMSCFVVNGQVSEGKFSFYEKAYDNILKNKELIKETLDFQKLRVSKEIISFGNYAQIFENELLDSSNFSIQEILFDSLIVNVNHKLRKIGSRKKTEKIVFFSDVKKGLFFAEFFSDFPSNRSRFKERPDFGESHVFLFEISGENLSLIDSKVLVYN